MISTYYPGLMLRASAFALAAASASITPFCASAQDQSAPADPLPTADAKGDIIVTGTRASGITAAESAAPIKLVNSAMMEHIGQPQLSQALTQLVPSFTTEAFGEDTGALTLAASLRGLSPNETLVLVNGKRRHGTANLHVLAGAFQGGASPDLDFITPASIDHIEVLEDGAAAQYGSDAIAGVINIILKKREGGSFSATGGRYYAGDGATYSTSLNYGVKLGDSGFLNLTGYYRFHDYSLRGGGDLRATGPDGAVLPGLSPKLAAAIEAMPHFPLVNRVTGDARQNVGVLSYNGGYDFGSVHFYSFGTLGMRRASAYENVRLPNRIVASPTLGVAGDYDDPDAIIFAPEGFSPRETAHELDYSATAGLNGAIGSWRWDVSTTYGRDRNRIGVEDSANASLFIDTHQTPTKFYAGTFIGSEWTSNIDIAKEIGSNTTLAFGGEYRVDHYTIRAGDAASRYKEGSQGFPGFQPTDAGAYERHNFAIYGDLAMRPIEGLKLDGAVRFERYSDFGNTLTGKLTGRYDFSPVLGLRGTIASGFRAPTMAEEYYSSTNVGANYAFVQLPADSAAAKLLGVSNLKPEKSLNMSAGLVLRPARSLTITTDAYQIRIRDRILGSGSVFGSVGNGVISPEVLEAIGAHGNVLDPAVTLTGINIFTNGATTRTRGIDVVVSYTSHLGAAGTINWTLSGNYNRTRVTKVVATPGPIAASGQALFDKTAISYLEDATPHFKLIGGLNWSLGNVQITARETLYGQTFAYLTDGTEYVKNTIKTAALTDLELGYHLTTRATISAGANNLFDHQPPSVRLNSSGTPSDARVIYPGPLLYSPYGINGGYYYARLDVKL